jgi:IS605 OrfB family transposase
VIRKVSISLREANTGKRNLLEDFLKESNRVINFYIDLSWEKKDFGSKYIAKNIKIDTNLSARMLQCLGKQALEIVKSQRKKRRKTKPVFKNSKINLDSRFVEFIFKEGGKFDFWIRLKSTGKKIIYIPAKKFYLFNKYREEGWKLRNGVRLYKREGRYYIDVCFEKEVPIKKKGVKVGCDTGYKKLAVFSDKQVIGRDLEKKIEKIGRKKQGSKSFKRALKERDEYINREIKKLDFKKINGVVFERLKDLKKGMAKKRVFRKEFRSKLQRWVYSYFLGRMKQSLEVVGVQYLEIDPAYTSQTCSKCGNKDKKSRNGEVFKCVTCGYSLDADYNASLNILKKFTRQENMVPESVVSRNKILYAI